MKVTDSNVIRFHLHILYGITVKSWEKKRERFSVGGPRIFGVPLENLPRQYIPEFGLVPCFLVDACSFLLERAGTVGLFRVSGSVPRIRALRAKLNRGEGCLPTALPYDIATLIKQFCRELPEPLFPHVFHAALLKAQELPCQEDQASALQLLSCLLPARNSSCLHYLFDFLYKISQRCTDNLMNSSNLATVFALCLLPTPNIAEMSEGRLSLRVQVVRSFIENTHCFGVLPKAVIESTEFFTHFHPPEDGKRGRKKRHSLKVHTVKTLPQGRSKVRPAEPDQTSASRLRRPLRRSLGQESFPNILLFRTCQEFSPSAAMLESPSNSGKDGCKTPKSSLKRDLCLSRLGKGADAGSSPILTGVGKLPLSWRRVSL